MKNLVMRRLGQLAGSALLAVVCSTAIAATPRRQPPTESAPTVNRTPPPAICSRIASLIDLSSREIAYIDAEGMGDNSAPRATMRELKRLNELEAAHMNLDRMIAYHCPDLPPPPDGSGYMTEAIDCQTALINAHGDLPDACKTGQWKKHDFTSAQDGAASSPQQGP